jgi:chromosome segregation ATPase
MHLVAKEEVEVQQLEDRIGRMQSRMNEQKQDLLRLKTDLEQGKDKPVFTYAGRNYTKDQVKTDLANRFQRFKTDEATLESMRKIHLARQNSVEAARQKLEGWLASKRQLQVEVENIEAKRQMIAAAQSTSNYQFDDSQLGRVKELVSDLQTRLDVEDRLVNAQDTFHDEIPLRQPTQANIVDQVSDYFAPKAVAPAQPDAKTLAKSK